MPPHSRKAPPSFSLQPFCPVSGIGPTRSDLPVLPPAAPTPHTPDFEPRHPSLLHPGSRVQSRQPEWTPCTTPCAEDTDSEYSESNEGIREKSKEEIREEIRGESRETKTKRWRYKHERRTPPPLPDDVARPVYVYEESDFPEQEGVFVVQSVGVSERVCGRPWERRGGGGDGENGGSDGERGRKKERVMPSADENKEREREQEAGAEAGSKWDLPPTLRLDDGLLFRKVG